jgi:hypothetical protein
MKRYKYYINSSNLQSQGLIVRHYVKLHRYKYDIKDYRLFLWSIDHRWAILLVYHLIKLSLKCLLLSEHTSPRPVSDPQLIARVR